MATRTISNAGGNYNATGTWVEGIVPTSADDIVSTATSGQLTINVASAAQSVNLTNYTNTVTMNTNWTVSEASLTNTLGASMNFAGTVGVLVFSGSAATIVQNTTNRIPNLRFSNTKTLNTNVYAVNYDVANLAFSINGNTIFVSGNLGVTQTIGLTNGGQTGTTKIICDGNGYICFYSGGQVEINTTGTYSTTAQSLVMANGCTFSVVAGNLNLFSVVLLPQTTSDYTVGINSSKRIENMWLLNQVNSSLNENATVNLGQTLIATNIATMDNQRMTTTDTTVKSYLFRGAGISASNIYLTPQIRTTSSTTVFSNTYKSINLKLNSEFTHTVGSFGLVGGLTSDKPAISSITASTTTNINLLSKETSQIVNYNFTDINATGAQIVAINGTLTRTTNVTTTYPSGGGSSGGSFTFVQ
jgi:hypothetical protein